MIMLLVFAAGLALGLLIAGVLGASAYTRGYEEARLGRRQWRTELRLRRTAERDRGRLAS